MTPTIYRVIPKQNNKIEQFRDPHDLAVYMLGRRLSAYIVIKSDEHGDRLVQFSCAEFSTIIEDLKKA